MNSDSSEHEEVRVRPTSATVIAWFWILNAVGAIVSSVDSYFKLRKFQSVRPESTGTPEADELLTKAEHLIGGTPDEIVLSILFAIIALSGAIGLLKLRQFGRVILITLTWLLLLITVIGTPLVIWQLTDFAFWAVDELTLFEVVFWVFGFFQLVVGVGICWLMLRSLHGQRIREAIRTR